MAEEPKRPRFGRGRRPLDDSVKLRRYSLRLSRATFANVCKAAQGSGYKPSEWMRRALMQSLRSRPGERE